MKVMVKEVSCLILPINVTTKRVICMLDINVISIIDEFFFLDYVRLTKTTYTDQL